ncbi:MAG: 1-acyl-sn-glycerol-3-phosphate acyltransferase [Rickettsiales bacterium]|jgi:1-acyl-sn-glycerol-3-phosphate acyltransferase|nr:1-acyl-sn-glycerol-3-phosphate acyltransferase [Rickettsiales bacterium]
MLRTTIFKTTLAVWFALWSPALIAGLASARLTRRFIRWDAMGVLWLAKIITGIRRKIHGKAAAGAIIASKHMSILEVAMLAVHCKNAFFIIKKELLLIPVYGWAFWRMGFIGVDRSGAANMKKLAGLATKKIRAGRELIIFPEGARAKPGGGVRLKRGLLFIAEAAGVPVQPVGANTGLFWPKNGKMRGGLAELWFEPVLPPDASLEDIAGAIARHSA